MDPAQQKARAAALVNLHMRRLLNASHAAGDHTVEQLFWALQAVVSRTFANHGIKPKVIGRRAAEFARHRLRTKLNERDAAKVRTELRRLDAHLQKPRLTLVYPKPES